MTFNAVIALILRFFAQLDRFSYRLYHSGWRYYYYYYYYYYAVDDAR